MERERRTFTDRSGEEREQRVSAGGIGGKEHKKAIEESGRPRLSDSFFARTAMMQPVLGRGQPGVGPLLSLPPLVFSPDKSSSRA